MCQGTRLSICRGCRATNRQKRILHLVEGLPKHEWQYCLVIQKVHEISSSLEHLRFEPFNQSSTQLLMSTSAFTLHKRWTSAELDVKSWVLDWLNGSNLKCSSENEIFWTFCRAKQYCHSCLGKPSTRCKMLLFVYTPCGRAHRARHTAGQCAIPWWLHLSRDTFQGW